MSSLPFRRGGLVLAISLALGACGDASVGTALSDAIKDVSGSLTTAITQVSKPADGTTATDGSTTTPTTGTTAPTTGTTTPSTSLNPETSPPQPTEASAPATGTTAAPLTTSVAANLTLSTVSPIPAAGDEAVVLFAGRKQITPNYYGVNAFYTPWKANFLPPDSPYYGVNTWHGGWKWSATADSAEGRMIPELSTTHAFFRGSPGTMLQFMIRNYAKTSGWTDADYDFEDFDRWAEFYRARGKKVVFNWYVNIWFDNLSSYSSTTVPKVSVARFRDALERVARRHGDIIQYWEGPNEPDSVATGTWSWYNTVGTMNRAQFAQTYRIASQVIKSVRADAKISGPHFSGLDNHITSNVEGVLKTSAAGGPDAGFGTGTGTTLANWIDVFGSHAYHATAPGNIQTFIDTHRTLLAAASRGGAGGKPHYISEWMSFDGVWPSLTLSNGETDKWRWFERQAVVAAHGGEMFSHFTWSQLGDRYADTAQASVRTRRAWWQQTVKFMTDVPVARIVKTTGGKIRVTRVDGKSMETGGAIPQ